MSSITRQYIDAGDDRHSSGHSIGPSALQRLVAPFLVLRTWYERRRQLSALSELDDRLLKDVGITRAEALRECRQRFWQVYVRRHLR